MRTSLMPALITLLCLASPCLAAGPVVEVGTALGLDFIFRNETTEGVLGVPGAGVLGQPAVYATFFSPGGLMLEPSIGVLHYAPRTVVAPAEKVGLLLSPESSGSLFVAVQCAQLFASNQSGDVALGGGLGYRRTIGPGLAVRLEGTYRRWLTNGGGHEVIVGLGLAGIAVR